MSGGIILRDGGHTGAKARVNKAGCLLTEATTLPIITQQSKVYSSAYEFHPSSFSLLTADGYVPVVYLKNLSELDFLIDHIRLDWNGGSTNFNRPANFRTFVGMSKPTANAVTGQYGASLGPHNLNLASNIDPEVDFQFWDGVGSGMTVASTGNQINCGIISQGNNFINYNGSLIIPKQIVIGVALKATVEDGKGAVVITGHFHNE